MQNSQHQNLHNCLLTQVGDCLVWLRKGRKLHLVMNCGRREEKVGRKINKWESDRWRKKNEMVLVDPFSSNVTLFFLANTKFYWGRCVVVDPIQAFVIFPLLILDNFTPHGRHCGQLGVLKIKTWLLNPCTPISVHCNCGLANASWLHSSSRCTAKDKGKKVNQFKEDRKGITKRVEMGGWKEWKKVAR